MKRKLVFAVGLSIAFLGFSAGVVRAEEVGATKVQLKSKYIPNSKVEADDSELEMSVTKFSASHEFKIKDKLPLDLSLRVNNTSIDKNSSVDLPSSLQEKGFGIGIKYPVPFIKDNEHYFMGLDVMPGFYSDGARITSDDFRCPFRNYFIDKVNEDFVWILGVSVRPEFENMYVPIAGFNYKANDRLDFNLASDNPNISFKLTDKTKLKWEFDYSDTEYEVKRGAEENVVLRSRYFSTGPGIEYDYYENVKVGFNVGGVFMRRLEYDDGVGKVDPNNGFYVGGKIAANF